MSTLSLTIRPEFFRLPTRGVDPHFGLSRAFYYLLDATGQVLLVRIRNRGAQRGITLVSYQAMSCFLAKAAKSSATSDKEDTELSPIPPTPVAGNAYRLVQRYPEETELMRKLTPTLLHDFLRTLTDLEQMVQAASHSA